LPSWRLQFFTLLVLTHLAAMARGRDKTDILVLKNGDRLTCEIKKLDSGILEVDLDYVDGSLAIDWSKVARIESEALFLIQLQDGSVISGSILVLDSIAGAPLKMEIRPAPSLNDENARVPLTVEQPEVVRMIQTSGKFWERFSGDVTLGALYAKGNDSTQYNLSTALDYQQARWVAKSRYNSNLSSNAGSPTTTRNQFALAVARLFRNERYFYSATADFLQSSVQGIQLQANLGLSLGMYFRNTNRMRFSALGGLGVQRSHYTSSDALPDINTTTVGIFASRIEMFRFKKMRVDLSASIFPALNQESRVFSKTNGALYFKVFGKIDWNFSFYGSWDTQPPPRFQGSDYGTSTGLSWSFGNN
jgi:hypothetical protein